MSQLTLGVQIPLRRGVFDATLCLLVTCGHDDPKFNIIGYGLLFESTFVWIFVNIFHF